MKLTKLSLTFVKLTAAIQLIAGILIYGVAQNTPSDQRSQTSSHDPMQVEIARAMSAGPAEVAKAARIVGTDAQGQMVVLREGNNGFTCMPGNPKVVGEPPMCAAPPSIQWFAHTKPHNPHPPTPTPHITSIL